MKIGVDLYHAAPETPGCGISGAGALPRSILLLVVALGCRAVLDRHFHEVVPVGAAHGLTFGAALEHQDVDHDVGAGGGAHAAFGQPDRADQVGHAGDVLAGGGPGLVHRAGAGYEDGDPAGPEPGD